MYNGATDVTGNRICHTVVCGNGRPPGSGVYCGRRPCDIFGCACGGGCIPGNSKRNFKRIHGTDVTVCKDSCMLSM